MTMTPEDATAFAIESRILFDAYIAAGYRDDQALALMCRPVVQFAAPTPSPETSELYAKMSVFLDGLRGDD